MTRPTFQLRMPLFCAALAMSALFGRSDIARAAAETSNPPAAHAHDHEHEHERGGDHSDTQEHNEQGHDHGTAGEANAHDAANAHDHDGHDHGDHPHDHESHADEVTLTPEAISRFGIRVATVSQTVPRATLTAPARITLNAERVAHITAPLEGTIAEVRAGLGDQVESGDVLLVIQSPVWLQMQSDLLTHQSAVAAARPIVELAEAAHQRARDLYQAGGSVSLGETQRRETELALAQRDLRTAQTALNAAAAALRLYGMTPEQIEMLARTGNADGLYPVRAPIGGEVINRHATLGERVGPDAGPLMILADLTRLWALVDVSEAALSTVGRGAKGTLSLPADPAVTYDGVVSYIAPRIDEATRTARLRIVLDNPQGSLRPGMFAAATITPESNTEDDVVLNVPADAVLRIDGQPSVFVPVQGEQGTFARRTVSVGPRIGNVIPIRAGLSAGDRVVVRGAFVLKADLGKAGAKHVH